jgi:hypothetical protein
MMSLEFELIKKSTEYSSGKLKNITKSNCPDLFFLNDFLYPPLMNKLVNFLITTDIDWQVEIYQEQLNRLKLNWIPDSVIEEVHIVLENLTSELNQKFNRNNKFLGVTIWKDQEGYTIEKHNKDNSVIDIALQLYLSENLVDLGTKFEYKDEIIQVNYRKNHGYLYDNSQGVPHYMSIPVPKEHIRYSLYAMWSNIT